MSCCAVGAEGMVALEAEEVLFKVLCETNLTEDTLPFCAWLSLRSVYELSIKAIHKLLIGSTQE